MNRIQNLLIIFTMIAFPLASWSSESKPKYAPPTLPLSQHHEFIQKNKAPDYWALSSFYVPQQDGSACGIASMTMLLNGLRVHLMKNASDRWLTQKGLLEKVKINYSRGLTLDQLAESVNQSLKEFGIQAKVDVIHADGTPGQIKKVRERLIQNEKSDRDLILANFHQTVYTGDPEGVGHISPIGAFNAKNNEVLIMDVDRDYYEPYWVKFENFYQGIHSTDSSSKLKRGLVVVELN
jgi:hypothetical protein